MPAFRIDPEIRAYLPPQRPEERERLERKIKAEGPHPHSLTVAVIKGERKPVLIDGHHTNDICAALKLKLPKLRTLKFEDRSDVFQWMRDHQLGRRNLTDEQRAYYIGQDYNASKKPEGKPDQSEQVKGEEGSTAERLAEKHNESPATIRRDAAFAEGVDKLSAKAREKVLTGEAGQSKAQIATGVFCRTCRTKGPKADCQECHELREEKRQQEQPKPTKAIVQRELSAFDDAKIDEAFDEADRLISERASALSDERASHLATLRKKMEQARAAWESWRDAAPSTTSRRRNGFTPPTLAEVEAYCLERGNHVDAEQFVDHYTANGWKVGKNPMKDWRASVRTWEKNSTGRNGTGKRSIKDEFAEEAEAFRRGGK